MKTREVKASQNFHPLILGAQAGSGLEAGDLVTSVKGLSESLDKDYGPDSVCAVLQVWL